MWKKLSILLTLIIVFLLSAFALYYFYNKDNVKTVYIDNKVEDKVEENVLENENIEQKDIINEDEEYSEESEDDVIPWANPDNVITEGEDEENTESFDDYDPNSPGIIVDQDKIVASENALYVSGKANVWESTVDFKLYDANNQLITTDHVMAEAAMGDWGNFEKEIKFPAPSTVNGYLDVFAYSAKDGSEIYKTRVPVYFEANDYVILNLYFLHRVPAGSPDECSFVKKVERYHDRTLAVARASIEALLEGPTENEKNDGFYTAIPKNVRLNDIYIQNKTAYVDFSNELNTVDGSCSIAGVYSEIEHTLTQFPSIDNVVISIEGNTDDILQP